MKQLCLLIGTAVLGILLVSCSAQKRVWYLQDAQPFTPEQIAENGQIRIKPLDRLTIVVNSKDPELAVPFNSATSYNSLTGTNVSSAANSQALQMRTVDENGMLEMPVIGNTPGRVKSFAVRAPPLMSMNRPHSSTTTSVSTSSAFLTLPPTGNLL